MQLGNIDIRRDWGWAPEYVDAMLRMLNQDDPRDFVIATGVTLSLQEFLEAAFEYVGLNWEKHVVINTDFIGPSDPLEIKGSPLKAAKLLSWTPQIVGVEVVKKLMSSELTQYRNE